MKVFFHSLGCKVNMIELEAVKELFLAHGWKISREDPDAVIINTCTVTETAAQKSRQLIRRWRRLAPDAVLIVMGCHAELHHEKMLTDLGADIVIGTSRRSKTYDLLEEYLKTKKPIDAVEEKTRRFDYEELPLLQRPSSTRAFIKIQDGCDAFCSYCIIPFARGRARSRPKEEILQEIQGLIANGYHEFVLSGIAASSYGKDLSNTSFTDLVRAITDLPDLYRLRISSLEISDLDEAFIALLAERPAIADHLHIPLQSGSPKILRMMNRKYEITDFLAKVEKIRAVRPLIALTTDVIVGFPGETKEDFRETVQAIRKIGFAALHVFPYARRENTRAASFPDQVDPRIKKARVKELLKLSKELHLAYASRFLGKKVSVILEEKDPKTGLLHGYTSNYLRVSIDLPKEKIGQIHELIYDRIE